MVRETLFSMVEAAVIALTMLVVVMLAIFLRCCQ